MKITPLLASLGAVSAVSIRRTKTELKGAELEPGPGNAMTIKLKGTTDPRCQTGGENQLWADCSTLCMDYDNENVFSPTEIAKSGGGDAYMWTCNEQLNQQWLYSKETGTITSAEAGPLMYVLCALQALHLC